MVQRLQNLELRLAVSEEKVEDAMHQRLQEMESRLLQFEARVAAQFVDGSQKLRLLASETSEVSSQVAALSLKVLTLEERDFEALSYVPEKVHREPFMESNVSALRDLLEQDDAKKQFSNGFEHLDQKDMRSLPKGASKSITSPPSKRVMPNNGAQYTGSAPGSVSSTADTNGVTELFDSPPPHVPPPSAPRGDVCDVNVSPLMTARGESARDSARPFRPDMIRDMDRARDHSAWNSPPAMESARTLDSSRAYLTDSARQLYNPDDEMSMAPLPPPSVQSGRSKDPSDRISTGHSDTISLGSAGDKEWKVDVDRSSGQELGIVMNASRKIEQVKSDGLLPEWNAKYPHAAVQVGDLVTEVNGQRNVSRIVGELRKKQNLSMVFSRRRFILDVPSLTSVGAADGAAADQGDCVVM